MVVNKAFAPGSALRIHSLCDLVCRWGSAMRHLARLAICCVAAIAPVGHLTAMQFELVALRPGLDAIAGNGPIVQGDEERLRQAITNLSQVDPSTKFLGLFVDSPGGNVFEAEKLGSLIHTIGLPVLVGGSPSAFRPASFCWPALRRGWWRTLH